MVSLMYGKHKTDLKDLGSAGRCMGPRAIPSALGLKPDGRPSARFEQFAQMIVSVQKADADREIDKSGVRKKSSKLLEKRRNSFV
jgi:hypothetical protein